MEKPRFFEGKTSFDNGLLIPPAGIRVPEGCLAAMTVDGVVTEISPGAYTGRVVVEVLKVVSTLGRMEIPPSTAGLSPRWWSTATHTAPPSRSAQSGKTAPMWMRSALRCRP